MSPTPRHPDISYGSSDSTCNCCLVHPNEYPQHACNRTYRLWLDRYASRCGVDLVEVVVAAMCTGYVVHGAVCLSDDLAAISIPPRSYIAAVWPAVVAAQDKEL